MSEEVNNVVESFNLNENDINTITKILLELVLLIQFTKKLIEGSFYDLALITGGSGLVGSRY